MAWRECMEFLLRPLTIFHKEYDDGAQLFRYLYLRRHGIEDHVLNGIRKGKNMTIVGGAGLGKTSLMRYLFIEISKDDRLFPIFLDYRTTAPDGDRPFLIQFVKGLRDYFEEIGHLLDSISVRTDFDNVYDHLASATEHLNGIRSEHLSKKVVVFLDDLDYAEDYYVKLLKENFMPYAMSDKVILILSVRPLLLNFIKGMDELCQYYYIYPQAVPITDGDLRFIMAHRLKTLFHNTPKFGGIVVDRVLCFLKIADMDRRLRVLMQDQGIEIEEMSIDDLPFNDAFYANLEEITCSNIRDAEHVFPLLYEHEIGTQNTSLNDDFHGEYIHATADEPSLLLDLVSHRRRRSAVLQNVLEYFFYNTSLDEDAYEAMQQYRLSRDDVDTALKVMTQTPYMLLDPRDVYDSKRLLLGKHFEITRKGVVYVESVLRNDNYYNVVRNGTRFELSSKSYYDDKEAAIR